MNRLLSAVLAGSLLVAATQALQDDPGRQVTETLPKASDLVFLTFQPEYLDAHALYRAASELVGNHLTVQDDETGAVSRRSNLQVVGNSIVLFDLPSAAERSLELLHKLDAEAGQAHVVEVWQSFEYRPRHISADGLADALSSFHEAHVNSVREAGVILVHGEPSLLAEMREMIERLDTAAPQVILTAYLVSPSDQLDPTLPEDLVSGLAELTGMEVLERSALGMVRTSVRPGQELSLLLDTAQETFQLTMIPQAVGDGAGHAPLSLSSVELRRTQQSTRGASAGSTLFRTSCSIEKGRYTVLGAAGAAPYFVVLKAQNVGN